jgi:hypothetical protein
MPGRSATAVLSTHQQTADTVTHLVRTILGRAGCGMCGRLALLRLDFISDPPPEVAKAGVTSFVEARVRELRGHSRAKTPVARIAKVMKRTAGALRQKAYALGFPLGHRR